MNQSSDITKSQLVEELDKYLFDWGYKDIERASIHGNAKLAGFILGTCFIDAMASFYNGVTKQTVKKNSGKRFLNFVKKYMKQYKYPDSLYTDIRCGLVHSYVLGSDNYVFTDANKAGFHFDTTNDGKTILNLEDFLADIRKAYAELRNDILTDNEIFKKARQRYLSMGIMGPIKVFKANEAYADPLKKFS